MAENKPLVFLGNWLFSLEPSSNVSEYLESLKSGERPEQPVLIHENFVYKLKPKTDTRNLVKVLERDLMEAFRVQSQELRNNLEFYKTMSCGLIELYPKLQRFGINVAVIDGRFYAYTEIPEYGLVNPNNPEDVYKFPPAKITIEIKSFNGKILPTEQAAVIGAYRHPFTSISGDEKMSYICMGDDRDYKKADSKKPSEEIINHSLQRIKLILQSGYHEKTSFGGGFKGGGRPFSGIGEFSYLKITMEEAERIGLPITNIKVLRGKKNEKRRH